MATGIDNLCVSALQIDFNNEQMPPKPPRQCDRCQKMIRYKDFARHIKAHERRQSDEIHKGPPRSKRHMKSSESSLPAGEDRTLTRDGKTSSVPSTRESTAERQRDQSTDNHTAVKKLAVHIHNLMAYNLPLSTLVCSAQNFQPGVPMDVVRAMVEMACRMQKSFNEQLRETLPSVRLSEKLCLSETSSSETEDEDSESSQEDVDQAVGDAREDPPAEATVETRPAVVGESGRSLPPSGVLGQERASAQRQQLNAIELTTEDLTDLDPIERPPTKSNHRRVETSVSKPPPANLSPRDAEHRRKVNAPVKSTVSIPHTSGRANLDRPSTATTVMKHTGLRRERSAEKHPSRPQDPSCERRSGKSRSPRGSTARSPERCHPRDDSFRDRHHPNRDRRGYERSRSYHHGGEQSARNKHEEFERLLSVWREILVKHDQ